ncbi:hypothetical protein BD410DRAFT_828901 [Rickenella mellea]|uniref:MATH domain-containing protein n=1 Tax=Rickenella mellea TaxID=50990 RepID=A0A4Y7Q1X8_9AGAM|nr:hypothetical protein BD410DRAFT_828901 [Rickenella mellea]
MDEPVSVRDHEAFMAKHMLNLGHDVKDMQVYTWRLSNWRKLDAIITSPEFECGGHRWRILLCPFGASNTPPNDTVSLYLEYADPDPNTLAPEGWSARTQFALVISNPYDPTIYTVRHTYHRFTLKECGWGYGKFSQSRKLFHTHEAHARPTIDDESAEVTAFVRVFKDPSSRMDSLAFSHPQALQDLSKAAPPSVFITDIRPIRPVTNLRPITELRPIRPVTDLRRSTI